MWLVFLGLHLVGLVGYSLLLRKSLLAKVDKFTVATVMQTGIALPALFIPLFSQIEWTRYDLQKVIVMLAAACLIVVFHYANVRALQYLEASVYSVLYNLRILFTTILGIAFLNEQVVWLRILGGLFILAAIFIVKQKGRESVFAKGMEWGLTAGALISFLNMTEKYMISSVGYTAYIFPVMLTSALIMWSVMLLRKQKSDFTTFLRPEMLQLMGLRAVSAYGFTLAFAAGGLLSVSSYISSLSVILIVVLGVLWLGERDYLARKIWATMVAVAGLTIILLSSLL